MENQKPSIGRIVHLIDSLGDHYAAIITAVESVEQKKVSLSIFMPMNGILITAGGVEFDETAEKPSTWHWPERI